MLTGKVHSLPGHIQAAYVQNIMKVLSVILSNGDTQQSIKVYSLFNIKKSAIMLYVIYHQFHREDWDTGKIFSGPILKC